MNSKENKIGITLLTSNIWADVFGNPVEGRDSALAALIVRYDPDIIMLQEAHPNWHRSEVLKKCLADRGYAVSRPDLNGNPLNYTPLIYRSCRFREDKALFKLFEGPNDYDSKSVSGSRLTDNASGISFAAMSTHFYFAQNEEGNIARRSNARELIECFDALCSSGIAGFCGGDFNCDIDSEPFADLNDADIRCASTVAQIRTNFFRTHHKNPVYDAEKKEYIPAIPSAEDNRKSIDHIVFRGRGVKICSYTVIRDKEALILSDHCPVLIRAEIQRG
ncbi:MAG: endonuclease/exonuclease/phosphatase family protein [Clostridia bacterium]|nr:endonuclease/exonuclease/phosphatase family protein [Clostridia bacterium]